MNLAILQGKPQEVNIRGRNTKDDFFLFHQSVFGLATTPYHRLRNPFFIV